MFNKLFGSGEKEANLSADEFNEKMKDIDSVIIDVRTPREFREGHIKRAINIDIYGEFSEKINKLDKTKNYLLYCHSGSRSYHAMKFMREQGFSSVSHLEDGILSWKMELEA